MTILGELQEYEVFKKKYFLAIFRMWKLEGSWKICINNIHQIKKI